MLARSQFRFLVEINRQCRFCSFTAIRLKGVRFSETGAYHGIDKPTRAVDLNEPLYIPNKYDSPQFQVKRTAYAILSLFGLLGYFAFLRLVFFIFQLIREYFREPNDLDMILNADPGGFTVKSQRYWLNDKINQAQAAGQNSELLEAELAYLDVRDAAVKAKKAKEDAKK
jgi:hypothetical protein